MRLHHMLKELSSNSTHCVTEPVRLMNCSDRARKLPMLWARNRGGAQPRSGDRSWRRCGRKRCGEGTGEFRRAANAAQKSASRDTHNVETLHDRRRIKVED